MAAPEKESDSPQKRFHAIMDKLFHAPGHKRPTSSSSPSTSVGIRPLGGKKRVRTTASTPKLHSRRDLVVDNGVRHSLVSTGTSQSGLPLCRPWDRGDFIKRLATFKSMTWFGKPKAVSPVSCARRGWVNVEMDIITCEACGARLLFSTPSSWSQQQVEKAAAVFSLKLDSGHKALCPWIDNACDEALALFPPTPAPALIQGYRERSSALLQLLALPVISSSAIDYMRGPQLEHFLTQPPQPIGSLDDRIQPSGSSKNKDLDNEFEAISANLYHQAYKLISLCGWEPRRLPYVVDCEDQSTKSAKHSHPTNHSPGFIGGQTHDVIVYPSTASNASATQKENGSTVGEHQFDPASVVLDCKLCGASVGLWAFSLVPQPLELFTVIEPVEVSGQKDFANGDANIASHTTEAPSTGCSSSLVLKDPSLSLNLTIAGGPPPAKQNFKATVTLPIISRHLRAELCSRSVVRTHEQSDVDQEGHTDGRLAGEVVWSEEVGTLNCERSEDEVCIARDRSSDAQSHLNGTSDKMERSLGNGEMSVDMPHEGRHSNEQGLPPVHAVVTSNDSTTENPMEMQNVLQNSGRNDALVEDAEISVADGTHPDIDCCAAEILQWIQDPQDDINDSSCMGTHLETKTTADGTHNMDLRKGEDSSDFQSCADGQPKTQMVQGVKDRVPPSVSNEILAAHGRGNVLKLAPWDKKMDFDPIRQHRHFCPWIAPADGASMPGWKQTLSAVDHVKEYPRSLPEGSPSALSIFEVDDPIASVRKLFMSPTEKRKQITHGSLVKYQGR